MSTPRQEQDPLESYRPMDFSEVELIVGENIPVPKHEELEPYQIALWKPVMLKSGTIICNLIHYRFPNAYCQIQMSPETPRRYHTFMVHSGPLEAHIAEDVVDQIFMENVWPDIKSKLLQFEVSKARRN